MGIMRNLVIGLIVASGAVAAPSFGQEDKSERVSLVQLISAPEKYEGKLVEVTGFVHIGFENNAVWLHRDDFDHGIYANAIWINVSRCVDGKGRPISGYASLMGRFTSQRHGHMGLWPGTIEQIGDCFPVPAAKRGT